MTIAQIANTYVNAVNSDKGDIRRLLEERYAMYFATADDLRGESPSHLQFALIDATLYEYDSGDVSSVDPGGDFPDVITTVNGRRYKPAALDPVEQNALINSNFRIAQRGTGPFTGTGYTVDRWRFQNATGDTHSFSQVAGLRETSEFALSWNRSVAAGGNSSLEQRVEDVRRFAGRRILISFDVIGDATIAFQFDIVQNFGSGGSAALSTADNVVTATTTLQRVSVAVDVPSVSGKTIGAGSFHSLRISRTVGQANGTLTFGDADMRAIPPGFNPHNARYANPDPAVDLARAKRYFQAIDSGALSLKHIANGFADSTSVLFCLLEYETKRTAPSISGPAASLFQALTQGSTATNGTAVAYEVITDQSARLRFTAAGTPFTAGGGAIMRLTGATPISIDAEL